MMDSVGQYQNFVAGLRRFGSKDYCILVYIRSSQILQSGNPEKWGIKNLIWSRRIDERLGVPHRRIQKDLQQISVSRGFLLTFQLKETAKQLELH